MFFFSTNSHSNYEKLAYSFSFNSIDDKLIDFSEYQGKVIVVVNVASRCGFTNQYEDLQNLWAEYKDTGLIIVGVPTNNFKQEPGSNREIKDFCETNFGINFPMSAKVDVIGKKAHPFYKWAKKNYGLSAVPKWNFHKIIIDKNGKIIDTFSSVTKPSSKKFVKLIEQEIKKK
jgi:glutathione peroxidase